METIGLMVATLCRARGVTSGALAADTGIHRNRLADKIAGRREFSESEIRRIADFFGIAPGRLFEDPLELLGIGTATALKGPACVTGVELVAA